MAVGHYSRFDPVILQTNGTVPFLSSYNSSLSQTITATHTSSNLVTFSSGLAATSFNALTLTANAVGLSIGGGTSAKTLTVTKTITLTAADDTSTLNIGTGGTLNSAAYSATSSFQAALSGTGFVKISGTTISYDNSTYLTAESDTLQTVTTRGATTTTNITAASFTKTGGTAAQFLKANGTVDSSTYLTSFTETDTLATVTGRDASTSTLSTFSGGLIAPTLDNTGSLTVGGVNATTLNLGTATTVQTVNIGTGSGVTTINLGGAGDTVNIAGTLTYVNTTDLTVTDKLIVLNKGGAAASGGVAGISIEENAVITGYAQSNSGRAGWAFKAPASAGTFTLAPSTAAFDITLQTAVLTANRTLTLRDATGTVALTSDTISGIALGSNLSSLTFATSGGAASGSTYNGSGAVTISPASIGAQPQLSGTGFVKASGTTISYDTNTYLTAEVDTLATVTGRGATTTATITAPTYALTHGAITSATLTTSATTASQVLDSVAIGTARTLKYLISVTAGSSYQCSEALIIHDGTNTYMTEYAILLPTGSQIATFDSTISGGNVQLLVTPVNAITTIKVIRTIVNV